MNRLQQILPALLLLLLLIAGMSCKHPVPPAPVKDNGYPPAVSSILISKCATAGCHNEESKRGAAGLSLASWDAMFRGSNGGAVVIPYRPDYSTLLYYVNTDPSRGLSLQPTMPLLAPPLSTEEYGLLKSWIESGAPHKDGTIAYSGDPARRVFFTANQGCDVVTVFDAASMLAMRCVDIGTMAGVPEAPHQIKAAPNNAFYCVCFVDGNVFQKIDMQTHKVTGTATIGSGKWNTLSISPDSETAYTFDLNSGALAVINLETMTAGRFPILPVMKEPHGTALNEKGDTLYVTGQTGNFIYKMSVKRRTYSTVLLGGQSQITTSVLDPHEIQFRPDFQQYFVTCQKSGEVRVMNRVTDELIATIPVGTYPQELAFSKTHPYLFVSCTEDVTTFPGRRGSVYIINYLTHEIVSRIYTGHQPHGLHVDDVQGRVYVSNRNVSTDGNAPHHGSLCIGRNGYITAIDLTTLQLVPGFKAEVSVDPYGVGGSN